MTERILKRRKLIIALFAVLTVLSLLMMPQVKVNYNLMDYLPKDSPSTLALTTMREAFGGLLDNGETKVLTPDVTVAEALAYKARIEAVPGIVSVKWLDDVADLNQPLSFIDKKLTDAYYRDGNALFGVAFEPDATGKQTTATLDVIYGIIGEEGAIAGPAVKSASTKQDTAKQVVSMMVLLVPMVLLIMLFATRSWFEPVLFIVAIGVAILINMGTNAMTDSISFVTQMAAAVLQLAVSMDYSIFLLHSFTDFRDKGHAPKEAMLLAMKQSYGSIFASAVTTILGFAVLMLMRFLIGPDMGFVLAKGVVFSLLSVTLLLPNLALLCHKLLDKTRHRSFFPKFTGFAKFVMKVGVPLTAVVCVLVVPAFLAQRNNTFIFGDQAMSIDERTRVGADEKRINELFGKKNQMVLLVPSGDLAAERAMADEMLALPYVNEIQSYVTTVGAEIPLESLPPENQKALVSGGYSLLSLTVGTSTEGSEAFAAVEKLREIAGRYYGGRYHLTGGSVNVYDMRDVVTTDNQIVTIAAIVAIGLVIMLTFRSLSLPILLVFAIEAAIWINLSVTYFSGTHLVYIGYMIISAVQLGATVDYAILYASRYLEKRRELSKKQAALAAVAETSGSILTSAAIFCLAGVVISTVSTNGIISQLGDLIGRGAALSAFMVLFMLPTLLVVCDRVIRKTTLRAQMKEGKP